MLSKFPHDMQQNNYWFLVFSRSGDMKKKISFIFSLFSFKKNVVRIKKLEVKLLIILYSYQNILNSGNSVNSSLSNWQAAFKQSCKG